MDGEARNGPGLQPLVPPPQAADPVALHQHGVDLIAAANLLALSWLREATAQHAAVTRRALAGMTTAAQSLPAAKDAADQARIILAALAGGAGAGAGVRPRHRTRHQRAYAAHPGGFRRAARSGAIEALTAAAIGAVRRPLPRRAR